MTKRMQITIPDSSAELLDLWAKAEGDKPASLAGFIVQEAIKNADAQGKIPRINVSDEEKNALCCNFLNDLAEGKSPDIGNIAALAHLLGIETAQLARIRDKVLTNDSDSLEGLTK